MKNILIDPYMFQLDSESKVKQSITFFQNVISLCKSGTISIIIYKGLYDKILSYHTVPFPLDLTLLRDTKLRDAVVLLNRNFYHIISSCMSTIDIESCDGEQEFRTIPDILAHKEYYDLAYATISACDKGTIDIGEFILIDDTIKDARPVIEESVVVSCNCSIKKFNHQYNWVSPQYFQDRKLVAFHNIKNFFQNNELHDSVPTVVRGEHHCPFQLKPIEKYEDISRKNKRVLALLIPFKLEKIIFSSFHQNTKYPEGTIKTNDCLIVQDKAIITAQLFCEKGFLTSIELYFPARIGQALYQYFDGLWEYKAIENLKTKLGI